MGGIPPPSGGIVGKNPHSLSSRTKRSTQSPSGMLSGLQAGINPPKTEKREQWGREIERIEHQRQKRSLQYTTKSYSPSKVAKEWHNIPFYKHTNLLVKIYSFFKLFNKKMYGLSCFILSGKVVTMINLIDCTKYKPIIVNEHFSANKALLIMASFQKKNTFGSQKASAYKEKVKTRQVWNPFGF